MSTPHMTCELNDVAKTVLMPGDPLRAEFIAKTYLTDVKQINAVRNMYAFTGYYKGKKVTVFGSGMGMPSIGIYSYELFKFYDVDNIIRIGSAGGYTTDMKVFDVCLASSAFSESSYALTQGGYKGDTTYPDLELNQRIIDAAKKIGKPLKMCKVHSSDVFYREPEQENLAYEKKCDAVEMESFALFHNANVCGKKAACLLTISDSFVNANENTTAEQRQNSFTNMMEIALESVE